jgi:hypothetical protein
MARNRAFSLDLNIDNPKDNICKHRNGQRAHELDPREFQEMLHSGQLTALGSLYGGTFTGVAEEDAAYSGDSDVLARKCVVVYVGGTAYRICS